MKKSVLLFLWLAFFSTTVFTQSNPTLLRNDISINRILTVHNYAVRLAKDPVSKCFFYSVGSGKIYKIIGLTSGAAHDSLVYTVTDHGVDFPQCIIFHDSILYVLGNNTPNASLTTGILRKGKLQSNGTRVWRTVMITEPHETCGYFDHKFSGMALSPAGDSITINSGSRGDHGEEQTNNGLYPNLRNVPLTSKLFRVATKDSTYLHNDSLWLTNSGFVFAYGIRNNFSMAYGANGNLFGLENSGDRDHNDEMNWLQRGHHYGFPHCMGDTKNPQQFLNYNSNTDKLINHYSAAWRAGAFHNDPTFPACSQSIVFDKPIQNIGPDCDKFRDTITGGVLDASDLGISIGTFTAHRSPLGLVFDNDSLFGSDLRGDAFMLSWTKGLDSTGGIATPYDTSIGPFVDPSQDLTHLHLVYDANTHSYSLSATRIVADFANPVDAKIDSNKIYVLENGYSGTAGLYEITMPASSPLKMKEDFQDRKAICYPNPASDVVTFTNGSLNDDEISLRIYEVPGSETVYFKKFSRPGHLLTIACDRLASGIYFYELSNGNFKHSGKLVITK